MLSCGFLRWPGLGEIIPWKRASGYEVETKAEGTAQGSTEGSGYARDMVSSVGLGEAIYMIIYIEARWPIYRGIESAYLARFSENSLRNKTASIILYYNI